MTARKCRSCHMRTVGTGRGKGVIVDDATAISLELCNLCMTEGDWENMHSDYGHDENGADTDDDTATDMRVRGCWVCHPELNLAGFDPTPRKGHTNTVAQSHTSHAGHPHARTPHDRALCRKALAATGKPYDIRKK